MKTDKIKYPIIGETFNRLTVIGYISKKDGYACECECGNITKARSWSLKTGRHASCGCLQKELMAKRNFKDGFEALKNETYKNYKRAAKKRGHSFKLSKSEFYILLSGSCWYCGSEPNMTWKGTKRTIIDTSTFRYNGVDRVDNNLGYDIDNVVSCCKFCNNAKNTLTDSEYLDNIIRVYNYQKDLKVNNGKEDEK